jgi:hypothetical protein
MSEEIYTISYSGLADWNFCPQYYYLVHVKRIKPWKNTEDTILEN